MSFSEALRAKAAPIWAASERHPFVRGIGDGSLPVEKFRFYICQDYIFLVEFSRVLALATARAHDLEAMARYGAMLDATLNGEMELHRGYCERLGIGRAELEATPPAPTTHAYTRHLLHVGHTGTLGEITASLIPCQRGYAELGTALAKRGEPVEQPLYAEWIRMYASPEIQAIATWACSLLDRLAIDAGEAERSRMAEIFLTSSRYEYRFWEMAWTRETWAI
ncbi:MAG: thiaminase II [Dehalococcoidia bacterium]